MVEEPRKFGEAGDWMPGKFGRYNEVRFPSEVPDGIDSGTKPSQVTTYVMTPEELAEYIAKLPKPGPLDKKKRPVIPGRRRTTKTKVQSQPKSAGSRM